MAAGVLFDTQQKFENSYSIMMSHPISELQETSQHSKNVQISKAFAIEIWMFLEFHDITPHFEQSNAPAVS